MYNTGAKLDPYNFEGLKYEQYMEWDKNELAECILDLQETIEELKKQIK